MSVALAPADGFAVVVDDLRAVAATFARLRDEVGAAHEATAAQLAGTAGMAGDDAVLARWRIRYDPSASALWAAASAAAATYGAIAVRLTATGDSYLAGEHAAMPAPPPAPERLPAIPGPPPGAGPPPASTGPDGVPDALAAWYPGGDPDRLRVAAAAWTSLGARLESAAVTGDTAFRSLLDANSGAAFSAMRTYWARLYVPCAPEPLFNAVALAARQLGGSCGALADLIGQTRAAVLRAAAEAADDMSPLDLPAQLLGRITWGVTELELLIGTGALTVSYLAFYRDRFAQSVERLAAELSPARQTRLERLAAAPDPPGPVGTALTDVSEVLGVGLRGSAWDAVAGDHPSPDAVHVTPSGVRHILDGDSSGGGHLAGAGRPGKTEFPSDWRRDKIIAQALALARDPGTVRRSSQVGNRWIIEGARDRVDMRLILADDGTIVSAFPLRGPGVVRNPPRKR